MDNFITYAFYMSLGTKPLVPSDRGAVASIAGVT